jgi:phosphopantothenoylcysteine decarboxylase/phosphopantothenate--cysteine ligase
MRAAMHAEAASADVLVMAAAVADFRPANRADHKIKKSDDQPDPVVTLDRNADILAELVRDRRQGQVVVGFAAETGDEHGSVLDHARVKLKRKGADLLVVNAVGDGKAFGTEDNSGWLLAADGTELPIPMGAKAQLASTLWDAVVSFMKR